MSEKDRQGQSPKDQVKEQAKAIAAVIRKKKRVARVFAFGAIAVVLIHLFVALFVSLPISQEWIISKIRDVIEEKVGLTVDVGYVSLDLLPPSVALEDVYVMRFAPPVTGGAVPKSGLDEFLSLPSVATSSLAIERVEVGLNPFAPVELKVIESVSATGLRFVATSATAFRDLLDYFGQAESKEAPTGDWWRSYLQALSYLPPRIELSRFEVEVGQPSSVNYLNVKLGEATVIKNSKNELVVLSEWEESLLVEENLRSDIQVDDLRTRLLVRPDRGVVIEEILFASGGTLIETQGSLHITEVEPSKGYLTPDFLFTLQVDAGIEASLLRHVGVEASGILRLSGELGTSRAGRFARGQPSTKPGLLFDYNGRASWENLYLDGIAVYSGSVDVRVKNTELYASNLIVQTPNEGRVEAEGRLSLRDNFPFFADILISDLPLTELLAGFGVETNAIEFEMASGGLRLAGQGRTPESERAFELDFAGLVEVSRMYVPSVTDSAEVRYPLPNCGIDLRLIVDAVGLVFDGSSVNCQDEATGVVRVPSGRLRFKGGHTDFRVQAGNFDLSKATYFTKEPLAGDAKIDGRIHSVGAEDDKEVIFEASVDASGFSYFGIGPVPLKSDLRIDGRGLLLRGAYFEHSMDRRSPLRVNASEVFVAFGDSLSRFSLQADGDLQALRELAPHIAVFQEIAGELEGLRASWLMNLGDLSFSQPQVKGDVRNFVFGPFLADSMGLDVNCTAWLCRRGRVELSAVRMNLTETSTPRSGSVALDFTRLSSDRVTARTRLSEVGTAAGKTGQWEWLTNANLVFDGELTDLRPEGNLSFADFLYDGQPLGAFELVLSKEPEKELKIAYEAFFSQLRGSLRVPWGAGGRSKLEMVADRLDLMFLRPGARVNYNLFSELTGVLKASGPSPFAPGAFESRDWLNRLEGQLSLESVQVSTQGISATLKKPVTLMVKSSRLSFDDLIIINERSSFAEKKATALVAQMNYHLIDGFGQASIEGELDLGLMVGLLPAVERAEGLISIDTEATFVKGRPSLDGQIRLSGDVVRITGFEPEIRSLEGQLVARGDRIEIIRMGAKKGEGSLDVLGSIRLPFREDDTGLEMGLRARLTRLQSRVPAPIFRSVDAVISGNLELTGTGRPYLLSGILVADEVRAYRDLECDEIVDALPENTRERIGKEVSPYFELDIVFEANDSVQFVTRCVRANLSARLRMQGANQSPRFSGLIRTEEGVAQVLKAKFEIQRGEIIFDSPIAFDPRLDVQMVSQIENYQLFMNIDGYSSSPRTSFWSDPAATPWGAPMGQVEILRMIASGRAPQSPTAEGNTLASQVANYVYGTTALDESLSKAFSKISAGLVDTVRLQPIIENGQTTWKASLSRSVGERFNLGLDVEQSPLVNNQSLTGTLYLNPTVNILGGVDRKSNQSESYTEVSGGFRFTFGGQ